MKPAPLIFALWFLFSVALVLNGEPFPEDATVRLLLPKHAALGDRLKAKFTVHNKGAQPLHFAFWDEWHVTVTDDQGRALPPLPRPAAAGFLAAPTVLKPGEEKAEEIALDQWVHILAPGTYTVSVGSALGWAADAPYPVPKMKIEIHSPTPKYAAAQVHALFANQKSPIDPEKGAVSLLHLRDPAYLPPLRREAAAGHWEACFGIGSIVGAEPCEVLLRLADSPNAQVAKAAAMALAARQPYPEGESWNRFAFDAPEPIQQAWPEKLDAPLLKLATRILREAGKAKDPVVPVAVPVPAPVDVFRFSGTNLVSVAAQMVFARGTSAEVPALMSAADQAVGAFYDPEPHHYSAMDQQPEPLPAMVAAIDALRHRGWIIKTRDGVKFPELAGYGGLLALLRQLADPSTPKVPDESWEQELETASSVNSAILRQNAWKALPRPFSDPWETRCIAALEDKDWGVVVAACQAAGDSGRKSLILPLAQLVEAMHPSSEDMVLCEMVRKAATAAAVKLGAGAVLWEAWANVFPEEGSFSTALTELCGGTIDLPTETGGGSSDGTNRAQRFLLRAAWHEFIEKHRDLLDHGGRVPRDDPSITPLLTGWGFGGSTSFSLHLSDGTDWPRSESDSPPIPGLPSPIPGLPGVFPPAPGLPQ